VSFGGSMKMFTFLESSVTDDSKIASSDWNFNLGAQFMQKAGIQFKFGSQKQQDSFNAFQSYTFNQEFFSLGGDETVSVYQSWLRTVKAKPAPIHTNLGSLKDFIDSSKDYDGAFAAYLQYCPHTSANGICNGFGSCDFEKQACTCSPGTYAESDGNCYPTCQDNCNGNGACVEGKCQCTVNDDGFGFTGTTCDTKCGTKTYDAGSGQIWTVPQDDSLALDKCTSASCDNNAGATCWCKYKAGYDDDDMQASYADTQTNDDTYKCDAPDDHCSQGIWPWSGDCNTHQVITCQYGDGASCPNNGLQNSVNTRTPTLKAVARKTNSQIPKICSAILSYVFG